MGWGEIIFEVSFILGTMLYVFHIAINSTYYQHIYLPVHLSYQNHRFDTPYYLYAI